MVVRCGEADGVTKLLLTGQIKPKRILEAAELELLPISFHQEMILDVNRFEGEGLLWSGARSRNELPRRIGVEKRPPAFAVNGRQWL